MRLIEQTDVDSVFFFLHNQPLKVAQIVNTFLCFFQMVYGMLMIRMQLCCSIDQKQYLGQVLCRKTLHIIATLTLPDSQGRRVVFVCWPFGL